MISDQAARTFAAGGIVIASAPDGSPTAGSAPGENTTLAWVGQRRGAPLDGERLWRAAKAAREYASQSQASNTTDANASDWRHFEAWCADHAVPSMPSTPAIVALYIADLAAGDWRGEPPRKVATIERRLAAINAWHKRSAAFLPASQKYPQISLVLEGIKRFLGMSQAGKRPLTVKMIEKMLAAEAGPVVAARDKALLLVGLEGALRRVIVN